MKFIIAALLAVMLTGCTTHTPYGECIGINGQENPALFYNYDTTNVVVAILLSETVIVPVIVILDDLKCPVSKR